MALLVGINISQASAQETSQAGKVTGTVVDSKTGDTIIGANVVITGTTRGTATDIDGRFTLKNIEPGEYSLTVTYISYARKTITGVKVKPGETVTLNISLSPKSIGLDEVTVTARSVKNNDAALLRDRQKSIAVSNAISAESISKSGLGDAAAAMSKVTGATVVDGKYVYVRGLGDRYSNTQLNGAELPSTDPNRNTVQMDIFPSSLLENIVTTKTFTPDKPGSFTGGSVDINTKSFPDDFTFNFSASTSYNSHSSFSDNFLTMNGGKTDWIGIDDGSRELPDMIKNNRQDIPDIASAWTDEQQAQKLDKYTRSLNPEMTPVTRKAPMNQSYALSLGNQYELFGHPLGALMSLTYSHKFSSYSDGTSARWQLTGNVAQTDSLNNNFDLNDIKSSENVLWGSLVNLAYKPAPAHKIELNFIYNRSAESVGRYQFGSFPRDLSNSAVYETRVLHYTERSLSSFSLKGSHYLKSLLNMDVDWSASYSKSKQDEPDLRFFTDNYTVRDRNNQVDTLYSIQTSIYPRPTRYFRNLDESIASSKLDVSIPFNIARGNTGKVKFGGAYDYKDRTFREYRFEMRQDAISYDGNPDTFFSAQNSGILESASTSNFTRFGNYVVDVTQKSSNYDGGQDIYAGYGMVELPVRSNLKFIGGVRFESTRMTTTSMDTTLSQGNLDNNDFLPSASLVYNLSDRMNLRAAYGRTLARPTFRELAPYASFNFVGDFIFIGNTNLKRTLVNNYDLRWEWFVSPTELVAVSGFYKDFTNPIERVILNNNGEIQFKNVSKATVYGAEFELRKQLDDISSLLRHVSFGANLSLIHSSVDIPSSELQLIRALDPNASASRPLQGQSPYVINLNLAYENPESMTSVDLSFNRFGERLSEITLSGTPNIYEQPRNMLNLVVSQNLTQNFKLKASFKNMLDASIRKTHMYKGHEYVASEYQMGRTFSVGISYNIN